jgi:hypothetical protein
MKSIPIPVIEGVNFFFKGTFSQKQVGAPTVPLAVIRVSK